MLPGTGDIGSQMTANLSLLRDLNAGPVRFRIGPYLGVNFSANDDSKTSLFGFGVGPRLEADWRDLYDDHGEFRVIGPARVGIYAGLGYGGGTGTERGNFAVRDQSGWQSTLGADVNLVNVELNRLNVGLDFFAQHQFTDGSSFNNSGLGLGGMLTFRFLDRESDRGCSGYPGDPRREWSRIDLYQAENAKLRRLVGELRKTLESQIPPEDESWSKIPREPAPPRIPPRSSQDLSELEKSIDELAEENVALTKIHLNLLLMQDKRKPSVQP